VRIGILGTGAIGATLARRLAFAHHDVVVANSRAPQTIPDDVLSTGAQGVDARDAVTNVDVLVLSVPFHRLPALRPLLDLMPDGAVVLDTSNYYPSRDGHIAAIDDGQVESTWVCEQLGGRLVTKAWNAIGAPSFATKNLPAGTTGRIAIPVAGDIAEHRALAVSLVEDTGFDGYDAGPLTQSWRLQPGTPAYCTDLTSQELEAALAAARPGRGPERRDLAIHVTDQLGGDGSDGLSADDFIRLIRLLQR